MSIKKRDHDRMLDKLQFDVRDTHHRIAWFVYEGKKILKTRRSQGRGDLPAENLIRQQMKLTSRQFDDALSCPLGYDDYVKILREKGLIKDQ